MGVSKKNLVWSPKVSVGEKNGIITTTSEVHFM
jgi:hypothetical protein